MCGVVPRGHIMVESMVSRECLALMIQDQATDHGELSFRPSMQEGVQLLYILWVQGDVAGRFQQTRESFSVLLQFPRSGDICVLKLFLLDLPAVKKYILPFHCLQPLQA